MKFFVVVLATIAMVMGIPATQKEALLAAVQEEVKQVDELMGVVEAERRQEKEEVETEGGDKWKQLLDMGVPPPAQLPAEDRVHDHCPPGYIFVKETRGCYKIMYDLESWKDAMEICNREEEGTSLVTFDTATEELNVQHIIHTYNSGNCVAFWTSGFRHVVGGLKTWMWYNGGFNMEYTHWAPGRPTSVFGTSSMCMDIITPRLMWSDSNCKVKKCFICEAKCRK